MAKRWVENTDGIPKQLGGSWVLPGSGVFVDEPDPASPASRPAQTVVAPGGQRQIVVDGVAYALTPVAGAIGGELARFDCRESVYASVWQGKDNLIRYSRTGVSSIHDHQGIMHIIPANELGREGMRRVQNLGVDARNFTNGFTVEASTTRTYVGGSATANQGVRLARSPVSTTMITKNSVAYDEDLHACTVKASMSVGTGVMRIKCERSSDSAVAGTKDINLSTTPFRRGFNFTPLDSSAHRITIGLVSSSGGGDLVLDEFFVQSKKNGDPNPDEFVTVGESGAASPFQGAFVDGVRYFATLNPCVLEADGNVHQLPDVRPLPAGVIKGFRRPPASSQRFLQQVDLTNAAWIKTNIGTPTIATGLPNPLGRKRAWLIPETAVTGAFEISQDYSGALSDSVPVALSGYVRRGPGRKWARLTLRKKDNTTVSAWFDTERGIWGTVDAGLDVADLHAVPCFADWWRIGHVSNVGTGATLVRGTLAIAQDDGVSSYAGVAGYGLYMGGLSITQNDGVSALVGWTAGSAVDRGDGHIEVPIASNLPLINWTIVMDVTPMGSRTDSKSKGGFHYYAYADFDSNNRFGACSRPGVAGGNAGDRDAAGFAADMYIGSKPGVFNGTQVRLGLAFKAGQTFRLAFGQDSVPRDDTGGGGFMMIGGVRAYATVTAVPILTPIENKPDYIRLGSNVSAGRHDCCFQNFVIYGRALNDSELVALGA